MAPRDNVMSSIGILVAAAVVIVLMLLFPPFHADLGKFDVNLGYSFVLYPPSPPGDRMNSLVAKIDALVLAVQFLGVTLATLFLWLAFRNK